MDNSSDLLISKNSMEIPSESVPNEAGEQPITGAVLEEASERPDFLMEDDSEEDDFVVTIGEIKTNVPFQKQRAGTASGTIDMDSNPTLKDGTPIYDLDLATMEDKPWRKPGADITDYFNYGFNEETWNQYCERQRKFRQEFGSDQSAINKAILSNIQLSGPAQLGLTTYTGGRQLVNLAGGQESKQQQQNKMQKIVVDLSKPPPLVGSGGDNANSMANPIPLMRTVISGTGIVSHHHESSSNLMSFKIEGANAAPNESGNTPVQSPMAKTPPPPIMVNNPPATQSIGVIDFSKPPPNFDPAIPPPMPPVANQIPTIIPTQQPQSILSGQPTQRIASMSTNVDLPPGVEEADGPPGVSEPPPGIPRMDFSQPPPTSQFHYNPTPSFISTSTFGGGPPGIHLPQQPPFSSRPPPLFQSGSFHRLPFGNFPGGRFHDRFKGSRGMSRPDDRSSDSESESGPGHRRRRRSRSRSRSPSVSRRHKEEKRKDKDREHKEKEGKKKKDKEKKEKHKSHRSPSMKKDKESRSVKNERRSSEREKDEKESSSRRRSSPRRKEKNDSNKSDGIKIKIERRSP